MEMNTSGFEFVAENGESLQSKEQLFLLDLSQKAEKRCLMIIGMLFYTASTLKFPSGF